MNRLGLFKKHRGIAAVILVSLIFQLWVANTVFHGDILIFADWGKWIYFNGPGGLYEHNQWVGEWPNHPPLITLLYGASFYIFTQINWLFSSIGYFIAINRLAPSLFLWFFNYNIWFGTVNFPATYYPYGFLLVIKLLPILASIIFGLFVYLLTLRTYPKKALFLASLFLILPANWYLSAAWGQSDLLGFIFLLAAFLCLMKRRLLWAPILFSISVNLKPTGLFFAVLFLWIYILAKPKIKDILPGAIFSTLPLVIPSILFSPGNVLNFIIHDLPRYLFAYKPSFAFNHAFNFWHVIFQERFTDSGTTFLAVTIKHWGYLIYAALIVLSMFISRNLTLFKLFAAMFITGVGSWMFLVGMHERYLAAGIFSGYLLVCTQIKYLKWWLILAFVFMLNMYHDWWYPDSISFLKDALTWNSGAAAQLLSILNVAVFLICVFLIIRDTKFNFRKKVV